MADSVGAEKSPWMNADMSQESQAVPKNYEDTFVKTAFLFNQSFENQCATFKCI